MTFISNDKILDVIKSTVGAEDHAIVVDTVHSQGSWLVDLHTRRNYLDCFSQFASQPLGWNHPSVVQEEGRLGRAALHKIANSDMYTREMANFLENLKSVTPDFCHHFLICGGAMAVENALKVAFDWKAQKMKLNPDDEGSVAKMDIIHLEEAFHGRSGYTMSLTNKPSDNLKTRFFPKFSWTRIKNPKINISGNQIAKERESLDQAEHALKKGNVAAIIMEPIQGEGGDNHFSQSYLREMRNLALKYETLLIFDEVQTGVGMTGKMWAYEHFGVIPDVLVFGKKMQVCGLAAGPRVDEVKTNVFNIRFRINSTWGGNIVDMVRADIFLDIIKNDDLVKNAANVGAYFLEQMQDAGLLNARGRGLMLAYSLPNKKDRDGVLNILKENMLCLPCGENSIRFRPHLTFTKHDVDTAMGFISRA